MTPETEGTEEKGPSGLPFINDPGNEDPGSLMDDATVPLNDLMTRAMWGISSTKKRAKTKIDLECNRFDRSSP